MIEIRETRDMAAPFAIRRAVFIDEQGIPEAEEFDGRDTACTHLVALSDGRAVGTARAFVADGEGRIGRVAVLPEARGRGIGRALVEAALARLPDGPVRLSAQVHAMGLYRALGFDAVGEVYDDGGIPHRDMVRPG